MIKSFYPFVLKFHEFITWLHVKCNLHHAGRTYPNQTIDNLKMFTPTGVYLSKFMKSPMAQNTYNDRPVQISASLFFFYFLCK